MKQTAVGRQSEIDGVVAKAHQLDDTGSQTAVVASQLLSRYHALCSSIQVSYTALIACTSLI